MSRGRDHHEEGGEDVYTADSAENPSEDPSKNFTKRGEAAQTHNEDPRLLSHVKIRTRTSCTHDNQAYHTQETEAILCERPNAAGTSKETPRKEKKSQTQNLG